jgi:hypothetical protein
MHKVCRGALSGDSRGICRAGSDLGSWACSCSDLVDRSWKETEFSRSSSRLLSVLTCSWKFHDHG